MEEITLKMSYSKTSIYLYCRPWKIFLFCEEPIISQYILTNIEPSGSLVQTLFLRRNLIVLMSVCDLIPHDESWLVNNINTNISKWTEWNLGVSVQCKWLWFYIPRSRMGSCQWFLQLFFVLKRFATPHWTRQC